MSKHKRRLKTISNKPLYEHNCKFCKFIKHISVGSKIFDLYRCKDCWVARNSNLPEDIWAMDTSEILKRKETEGSPLYQVIRKIVVKYKANLAIGEK